MVTFGNIHDLVLICHCHRGPLIINPIYTLYRGYLLGPNPLLKGSDRGVKQLGALHPKGPPPFSYDQPLSAGQFSSERSLVLTVTIEYMLMWTLIWCFALQWVLFRNSKVSFFFTKACPIVAPVEHRHNCSSCLQSCRFQTALGLACSFQDRTWSKPTRIGHFRGPWFTVFQHGGDQRSPESFSSYI